MKKTAFIHSKSQVLGLTSSTLETWEGDMYEKLLTDYFQARNFLK